MFQENENSERHLPSPNFHSMLFIVTSIIIKYKLHRVIVNLTLVFKVVILHSTLTQEITLWALIFDC
jgi:hypothetical protein